LVPAIRALPNASLQIVRQAESRLMRSLREPAQMLMLGFGDIASPECLVEVILCLA
jgi:hypothetical protein